MPGTAFQSARSARACARLVRRSCVRGCGLLVVFVALVGCSSTHTSSSNSGTKSPFGNAGSGATLGKTQTHATSTAPTGIGYEGCTTIGMTRACCTTGMQTCSGASEFANWGPCLDANGVVLQCGGGGNDTCLNAEFGCSTSTPRDGGTGDHCAPGEFGPGCSGGPPPPPGPPPPGPPPPPGSLCADATVNNEPEILAAYAPASGQTVGENGQIKVWVTDEAAALIGPGEQVDPATGEITVPGDHVSRAPDGFLWEPALYIAPATAERGGAPHFPRYIGGWYDSVPLVGGRKPAKGTGSQGPAIQSPPAGTVLSEKFNTEYVWNVSDLGLAPGTYDGEFIILDGDLNRAVGCVTIVITP